MFLTPIMAIGVVTLSPSIANAAVPEVRTPLAQGKIPYARVGAVFGSTVVWDTQRSTNGGSTWVADPALATSPNWDFVGGGQMVSSGHAFTTGVVVYTPGSGSVSYVLPSFPSAVNGSYATFGGTVRTLSTGVSTPLTAPTGAAGSYYTQELSAGNAILWHGTETDGTYDLFAAAPNLTTAPGAWVQVPDYQDYTLTDTDFLYVVANTSGVSLCKRPVASMSTVSCIPVASGDFTTGYVFSVTNMGTLNLLQIDEAGAILPTNASAYVVTAGFTSATKIAVPAGSSVTAAIPGDSPYLLVTDANTVPTVQVVAANGSLSPGFTIPSTRTMRDIYLAVAPNRVEGADARDGSWSLPVWSRNVSASGFGAESALSRRASGVMVSAGRSAIVGRDGVSMYDRGALTHTFADAAIVEMANISGPYVIEGVMIGTVNERTLVWKADGTFVSQYTGLPAALFGSQYIETTDDVAPTGSKHVVVHDLTGVLADAAYTLPAGTADCGTSDVWGSRIALYCYNSPWADTARVYDYKTGAFVGTTPGMAEVLGDGYALVSTNDTYEVWNLATNSLDVLPDCHSYTTGAASDGVGHVVCQTPTELVWRDYSALATSAGRVLGWMAPSAFASGNWTPQADVTKAYAAGVLRISQGATIVRDIPVPASADGSLRGVSWDGKDAVGAVVPSAAYTATLMVSGVDGSGAVKAIDGVAAPTFQVLLSTPGSFAALTPTRLLDTRDGTGAAAAGAVAGGGVANLQVTGRGGVPSAGVGSVILNVTAVTPAGPGYLTVYPTGGAVPNASNLNFTAGQVVPNLVVAKVGAGGKVSIQNTSPGATHVVADVAGYFTDGTVTEPGGVTAVTPSRLLDTRDTGVVPASGSVKVQAAGQGGVPATGVAAVVVNLTAVTPTGSGFLTAYPTGGSVPNASNVNFTAGQVVPNLAFVKLAGDGSFTVKNTSPGATHVVADVSGYVLDGAVTGSGMFVPLTPTRVLDTRPAYGGSGAVGANAVETLTMTGAGGVPLTGVSGVVLNVTAVASASGFLTVYPADVAAPNASNVNFTAGQVVPNLVAVKTSATGQVTIRNTSPGATNVIADVAGYFTA